MTENLDAHQRQNMSKTDLSMIFAAACGDSGVSYSDALRILFFPRPGDCTSDKVPGIPVRKEWWEAGSMGQFKQWVDS
jgi:hypothetical protein